MYHFKINSYNKPTEVNLYSGKTYLRFRLIHLPMFGKKNFFPVKQNYLHLDSNKISIRIEV